MVILDKSLVISLYNHVLKCQGIDCRVAFVRSWLPCHKYAFIDGDKVLYKSFFSGKMCTFVGGYVTGIRHNNKEGVYQDV